jgi:hypothetical protein
MVVLSKIYTRTGDDGTTALGSGRRVAKYDLRVECYGTLDETNAAIGLARVHSGSSDPTLDAMLARIQNDLFDLGAELCYPDESKDARGRLSVSDGQVERHIFGRRVRGAANFHTVHHMPLRQDQKLDCRYAHRFHKTKAKPLPAGWIAHLHGFPTIHWPG